MKVKFNKKKKEKLLSETKKLIVNILDEKEIIEEFEVAYPCKDFEYDNKKYNVINEYIYLRFTQYGYKPYLFFNKNESEPINFQNRNKGIPSRALKLLWNTSMYKILFTPETDKTNKLIIIALIGNIITLAIGLYLKYR